MIIETNAGIMNVSPNTERGKTREPFIKPCQIEYIEIIEGRKFKATCKREKHHSGNNENRLHRSK